MGQADRHYDGLDDSRPHHTVGHTAHRSRRDVQRGISGFTAKPPEDLAQPRGQRVAADPQERRDDQRQDDLQDTLAKRSGRIDQRLPQPFGVGFKQGPDVSLGKQHLVPRAGEAFTDDRQAGEPRRYLRGTGEVVPQATRPLSQTLAEARRQCHQRQDHNGQREHQQQRRHQPAPQPASEQGFAQRPRRNRQDRAEQDPRAEGSQHCQNAKKQTCEEKEQEGALKELRGFRRGGGTPLLQR
jgi:hypothetical protein